MYEQSKFEILNILSNFEDPQTSTSIARQLGLSEKTTRKYLNVLKAELENHGATLSLKQGSGCVLSIHDKEKYNSFVDEANSSGIFDLPESRKTYILTKLALTNEPINIYDMADEMFLSPSSLRNCITSLKPTIARYNLQLYHSHNHGYKITGEEEDIRRCLTSEWGTHPEMSESLDNCNFKTSRMRTIYEIVKDTLDSYSVSISEESLSALAMHVLMAINRSETDNEITVKTTRTWVRSSPEYFISYSINHQLKQKLNFSLSDNELYYLTLHINGKPRGNNHEELRVKINTPSLTFYNKFLKKIIDYSDIDFFEDKELRTSLLNHIVPFLNRLNNHMLINKSALPNIKQEFPYAYDLALVGLSFMDKDSLESLTPEEISYFALHIALSLEKQNEDSPTINVAIVGLDNQNLFKIDSFKLNKLLGDYINSVAMINLDSFKGYENKGTIHLLLNASSNAVDLDIPVVRIHKVLDETDLENISKTVKRLSSNSDIVSIFKEELFFTIDAENKEDLLKKQIKLISNYAELPEGYYESIIERENMTSTSFDNGIAIPHSLMYVPNASFISIARLRKPIDWDNKKVQLVFLICTHDSQKLTRQCFSKISKVISNSDLAYQLLNADTYQEFIDIFESN